MSFVITGNDKSEGDTREVYSSNQAPYRYTNYLSQPLVIEPDSEVAVVSVKVNKDGRIYVSDTMEMYIFFNVQAASKMQADATLPQGTENTNGMGIQVPFNIAGGKYVSVEGFCKILKESMLEALPFPDFLGKNNTLNKVEVVRNSGVSGNGWAGFKLTFEYQNKTSTNLFPSIWEGDVGGHVVVNDLSPASNGKKISTTGSAVDGDDSNWALGGNFPISRMEGEVIYDISPMSDGSGDVKYLNPFMVGLQRWTDAPDGDVAGINFTESDFSIMQIGFDYAVSVEEVPGLGSVGDMFLKVGHLTSTDNAPRPYVMNEIPYYENQGSSFDNSDWDGRYNMTNQDYDDYGFDDPVKYVKFCIKNEIVEISVGWDYGAGSKQWALLSSQTMKAGVNCPKQSYPKVNGQTTWNLYPKVFIHDKSSEIHLIDYWGCNTGYDADDPDGDFQLRNIRAGDISLNTELDIRKWNIMTDTLEYDYKGVVMNLLSNYNVQLVVGQLDDFGEQAIFPFCPYGNMNVSLGFPSRAYVDVGTNSVGTQSGRKTIYISDSVPAIDDTKSMFIRLDNFTNNSFNAHTHNPSKILYHFPRFDTSGRDSGYALFYEPANLNYIPFKNTDIMKVNELALSIVDIDEKVVVNMTGQTIICLSIRKCPKL